MNLAIDHLLQDPDILEIMIDGYDRILVEKHGKLQDVPSPYRDEAHLMEDIRAIVEPLGLVVNESYPIVDAHLEDGSRVNIVAPPISMNNGAAVTIRKFLQNQWTAEDLIEAGAWTEQIVAFLRACVQARLNTVIAGGTGSGKTTVMNIVCNMIPLEDRVVVVQRVAELKLELSRIVHLESRPANLEGRGEITIKDLVMNSVKMRPDRIIVGEVFRGEAYDMLQAMNTGHDGAIFTLHAISPRDVLARLELMMAEGSPSTPLLGLRQMIASGLNLVVHQERLTDGTRRILKISEVAGLQGDTVILEDIFEFRQTGMQDGKVLGYHTPTGYIPRFLSRSPHVNLPVQDFFTPR